MATIFGYCQNVGCGKQVMMRSLYLVRKWMSDDYKYICPKCNRKRRKITKTGFSPRTGQIRRRRLSVMLMECE